MVKIILDDNSKTRILPDTRFAMGSDELKEFHFALYLSKKIKTFSKKKNAKYPIFGLFGPNLDKNIFHKNRAPSHFSIYNPLISCKKTKKLMSQFLEKLLTKERTKERRNDWTNERTNEQTNELSRVKLLQELSGETGRSNNENFSGEEFN